MDFDSEDELDGREHKLLVDNILNLNTRQYVNKPTRTEPTAEISEYNLIKSLNDKDNVRLHDLTKSLKNRAVDIELRKKVKKAEGKSKTLSKPLEKPQAERIKRSTAYEITKKHLDRWDSVVTVNRVSTNLSFPLKDPNFDYKEARDFTSNWVLKSNLEKELEKIEPKIETIEVEAESRYPMTLKQMIEKRKEMAKLRRYQSYKEMKTRWQNKIKSKTFRRILRKEKIKQQMKEFELLQKTNPEEALKKLNEIEKARAEERASLRHKSTGKWARNQQVRAKYDKESRKVLSEQLAISKDLMQKQQIDESSESTDDDNDNVGEINDQNSENLWVNEIKPSKEVEDFVSGCRKFWENQNSKNSEENFKHDEHMVELTENSNINKETKLDDQLIIQNEKGQIKKNENSKTKRKKKNIGDGMQKQIGMSRTSNQIKTKPEKRALEVDTALETWEVTSLNMENDTLIDNIFDDIEYKVLNKVDTKFKKVKSKLDNDLKSKRKHKSKGENNNRKKSEEETNSLSVKESRKSNGNIELSKKEETFDEQSTNKGIDSLKSILESQTSKPIKANKKIETNNIINAAPVSLNSSMPDLLSFEDNEELMDTGGIITEAFEDNDIVEEFAKDKKEEIEKAKPKDIDLTLPGWGSWGGKDIPIPKKKRKRFIIKAPKKFPRKDMNKGHLIINESANDNIKPHLVSEIPFPFKTVKDFEASVRAPIGNTFVPETAFRRNIKPILKTRMGAIIEPITEDILLRKEKKK